MHTIRDEITYNIIIKNSKFICILSRVNSVDEVNLKISEIKNKYPQATHYCYGYTIDDLRKSCDDGEPNGTAGLPILKVLMENDLNYVFAIVVRYFGGMLLGANGLIRAYSKVVANAIKKSVKIKLIPGYIIKLKCSYSEVKQVEFLLRNAKIISKDYQEKITYIFQSSKGFVLFMKEKNYCYEVIDEVLIEEFNNDNSML